MATFRAARTFIRTSDTPARQLTLVNEYIQHKEKLGKDFIMPTEREVLSPIVDEFVGKLPSWLAFLREMRDSFPARSAVRADVHELFRTVDIRLTQREMRRRLNAAVAVAIQKGIIKDDSPSKVAYIDRCKKLWILRRKMLLKSHRDVVKVLPEEQQRQILDEFWANIDAEIKNGEVPKA